MKKYYTVYLLFILLFFISSCEKEEPEIPNQEELITTVKYILVPENGGEQVEFVYRDLDGEGGNEPIVSNGILTSGTIYSGTITLLNETESPAEDISEEVKDEAAEHQFFFASSADIIVQYNDNDLDGNPVGLETLLITGDAGTGNLTIVLRHEPDKFAAGVSEGNVSNAGGETDVEVQFNATIQ